MGEVNNCWTWARIFVDDDNNSKCYALSPNDSGSGRLRFYSRGVRPVSLDTKNKVVPHDDNWYFVTTVHNSNTKQRFIYVNCDLEASGTYTGTWGSDSGIAAIGWSISLMVKHKAAPALAYFVVTIRLSSDGNATKPRTTRRKTDIKSDFPVKPKARVTTETDLNCIINMINNRCSDVGNSRK